MCAPPAILPESVKLPTHCEDKSPFLFLFIRHIALVLIEVQLLAACYKAFTSLASELGRSHSHSNRKFCRCKARLKYTWRREFRPSWNSQSSKFSGHPLHAKHHPDQHHTATQYAGKPPSRQPEVMHSQASLIQWFLFFVRIFPEDGATQTLEKSSYLVHSLILWQKKKTCKLIMFNKCRQCSQLWLGDSPCPKELPF